MPLKNKALEKVYMAEYRIKNVEKNRAYQKQLRDKNPDRVRGYKLKQTFGITLEQYNSLFASQEGKCAICKTHQTEFKRALAVDHSHETNEIRGLLCHLCNHLLGNAKENIQTLDSAKEYLTKTAYTGLRTVK